MRIAIVHHAVDGNSRADDQDVLEQVGAISRAIAELGHCPVILDCDLDLDSTKHQLESIQPDMVFNLVESLNGEGRLIHLFPALLDAMGIPYTGARAEAIFMTSHKILSKDRMMSARVPTPLWWGPEPLDIHSLHRSCFPGQTTRWLIKSVWEHASLGLGSEKPITDVTPERLTQILKERASGLGKSCFAEVYIPGREFNLSLIEGSKNPEVLPPAEIIFEGFEMDRLPIVGYKAKWDSSSYEYHHTPRCFDFPSSDHILLEKLQQIAIQCWHTFSLKGYARIDFRVDPNGRPWVLEVNSNPCLSPDAGFSAAVTQASLSYTEAISRIITAAKKAL